MLLQHVIVNANYFDGYVSMMQINQFQFQFQESTWNEVVKKEVKLSLNTVPDDIQAVQNTLIESKIPANEQRDKESRRKNIIIYKIPETARE